MNKDNHNSISVNKYISATGICSRREADELIKSGRVTINGSKATLGNRVTASDEVRLDGRLVKKEVRDIYIAFNKPVGIVSTTDHQEKDNIIDYINHPERLFPIGRLDKDSEGLILLTNNGDIVNKVLRAGNAHEKVYIVTVNKPINDNFIDTMSNGVPILGTVTNKCYVGKIDERTFKIVLTQGLNRQIRRMCEHLGYKVKKLKRIRIININLGNLPSGKWKNLSKAELKGLFKATEYSKKTH